MELKSISELKKWMCENCYNNTFYSLDGNFIDEGFGIRKNEDGFYWYFTERGQEDIHETFKTEAEIVAFAYQHISSNLTAQSHCLGLYKEQMDRDKIIRELVKRNIKHTSDSIPYGGIKDPRFRIFVYGCDINKVADLLKNYPSSD